MNRFYKVSYEQFCEAVNEDTCRAEYDDIKLPERSTALAAGYDFFAPHSFTLNPGDTIRIPTGIGVVLDEDKFLAIVPRSGLGFKFRLQLDNTIGIIDADYCGAENGGHIMAKLTNDGHKRLEVEKGKAFMHGINLPYFKTDDDKACTVRVGGFGSTDG